MLHKWILWCVVVALVLVFCCCTEQQDETNGNGVMDDDSNTASDDDADDSGNGTGDDDSEFDDDTVDDTDDDDADDDMDDDTFAGYIDPSGLCPPNFVYFPAGTYTIVRKGSRGVDHWEERKDIPMIAFCLAQYESSQPTATSVYRGDYEHDPATNVPPAQVKPGVIPWGLVSWYEATKACQQQEWRLPQWEELQVAMGRGRPDNIWGWGGMEDPLTHEVVPDGTWSCGLSELSWFATCAGPRELHFDDQGMPISEWGITGGTSGMSDYGSKVYDLLGNVAEWTYSPWDVACYGMTRPAIFASSFHGRYDWVNAEKPDPDHPGCYGMSDYEGNDRGRHEHPFHPNSPGDDGFRCAAEPSERWLSGEWQPRIEPNPYFQPQNGWLYDWSDGHVRHFTIPADPYQGVPQIVD